MNHFFLFYFIILGIVSIRILYARHRFLRYCKEHYPEKASEFLSLGEFTLSRALFRESESHDLEFITLKNKAKNAYASLYLAVLIGVFFVLITVVIPFILGR